MVYVCEFEFFDDGEGSIAAFCLNDWGGATFGDDLEDAVESAADWLAGMVDDCLANGRELPPATFGAEPAADAARALGVSTARISQLVSAGLLDSWRDGTRRMVSRASVEARLEDPPRPGRPRD